MRIAQLSDLHYANDTLAEVDRCVGYAVDVILRRPVDAVVISGDATDHQLDAHAPAFVALAKQVRRLADHAPVLLLQGTYTHEPPGTLEVFRLLGGRFGIHVADRIEQVALRCDGRWQASTGWRFAVNELHADAAGVFSCLPSINKAALAGVVGGLQAAESVGDSVAAVLSGFGVANAAWKRHGIATIGISHGTVNGCVSEHGVPMAGLDHEFSVATLFAAGASAFLLGHIHRHQQWTHEGRRIAYPGSIARLHYGEQGEKGFLVWEVAADRAESEFIATPARRMLQFDFSGLPDLVALKAKAHEVSGAAVRVRWCVPEEDRHSISRAVIRELFADAAAVKLEERIIPVVRARAPGITQSGSLADKLKRWAQTTGVESEALLSRLALSEANEPEAIVAELLDEDAAETAAATVQERCRVTQET